MKEYRKCSKCKTQSHVAIYYKDGVGYCQYCGHHWKTRDRYPFFLDGNS